MNEKKNMRRISVLVTAQTAYNLDKLADMCGYRERGHVTMSLRAGTLRHTVTVADDGVGFDPQAQTGLRMGLSIVGATVRDKLKGKLRISSDGSGTRASFDFRA